MYRAKSLLYSKKIKVTGEINLSAYNHFVAIIINNDSNTPSKSWVTNRIHFKDLDLPSVENCANTDSVTIKGVRPYLQRSTHTNCLSINPSSLFLSIYLTTIFSIHKNK